MTIVAGVDFGTLSVRVTLVDSQKGPIGTASASYPLHRRREDPNFATQSHADQMARWPQPPATRSAHRRRRRSAVAAIALDTTGSSVIPVGEGLEPLDEYYLWCDHRAFAEAEEITAQGACASGFEGIEWCGGVYSHEWGFAKLLHWLRHNPEARSQICHRARTLRHGGRHALRHHRPRASSSAASAPWATSGCGIPSGAACRRRSFWSPSTRSSPACAPSWAANT
jgi:ribulose kinase